MDTSSPKNISDCIKSSKKIFLVTHSRPSIDSICALGATYSILKNHYKKDVDLFIPSEISNRFNKILEYVGITKDKLLTSLPEKAYVITIDKETEGNTSTVTWNEDGGKFNFIINPNNGELDLNSISIKEIGANYDLIITVDTPSLNFLGELYKNNQGLFKNNDIISFDNHKSNSGFAKYSLSFDDIDTTSQVIAKFAIDTNIKLSELEANLLFAGIYSFTNINIKNKVRGSLFIDLSNLFSSKVKLTQVNDLLYSPQNINEIILIGDLMDSTNEGKASKLSDGLVVGCKINLNREEIETIDLDKVAQIMFWNIKIPNAVLGYLVFQKSLNESIAYLFSYDESLNISEHIKDLNGKGEKTSGKIIFTTDMNTAVNKIKDEFGIKFDLKDSKMPQMGSMFDEGFDDFDSFGGDLFPTHDDLKFPQTLSPQPSIQAPSLNTAQSSDEKNEKSSDSKPVFDPRKGA